jgi:hypothetical protein
LEATRSCAQSSLRSTWPPSSEVRQVSIADITCSPSTGAFFGPRTPRQGVHRRAKAKSGLSSLNANHIGVLRGFVSAYWQNDVAGTTQRRFLPSQPRQCGLFKFRMFVTG